MLVGLAGVVSSVGAVSSVMVTSLCVVHPDPWGRLNIAHERYSVSDCTYLMSFACLSPAPPGFRLMRTARADITTQKSLGTTLGSERLAASVVLKSRST